MRTPTYKAPLNGIFASDDERFAAVKSILRANLQEHNLKYWLFTFTANIVFQYGMH